MTTAIGSRGREAESHSLMLVSACASKELRNSVAVGERPNPEYLRLEGRYHIELVDWTRMGFFEGNRSVGRSIRHSALAARMLSRYDAVLTDGEHVGFPLALSMKAKGSSIPHVMLGHHLLTSAKTRLFRTLKLADRVDRIIVHSGNQVQAVSRALQVDPRVIKVVPYGIDEAFWSSTRAAATEEQGLVVSAGREHRDYATLLAAMPHGARLTVADHSLFSPDAEHRSPVDWPPEVERVALGPADLRELYARASVVVVPVTETDFPAGITTVLEAMSMGKAVVVSGTTGLRRIPNSGEAVVIDPGDVDGMGAAIRMLLNDSALRQELGQAARAAVEDRFSLDSYADSLYTHVEAVAHSRSARGMPR